MNRSFEQPRAVISIIGLSLISDRGTVHQFAGGTFTTDAALEVSASYHVGEWQFLGAVAGEVVLVGTWQDLPRGRLRWQSNGALPARQWTVFGYDLAAEEAVCLSAVGRHWVDAAHAALRTQPASFQLAGVAAGRHTFIAGSTWQDLVAASSAQPPAVQPTMAFA